MAICLHGQEMCDSSIHSYSLPRSGNNRAVFARNIEQNLQGEKILATMNQTTFKKGSCWYGNVTVFN
jgi:hypothetical protein